MLTVDFEKALPLEKGKFYIFTETSVLLLFLTCLDPELTRQYVQMSKKNF